MSSPLVIQVRDWLEDTLQDSNEEDRPALALLTVLEMLPYWLDDSFEKELADVYIANRWPLPPGTEGTGQINPDLIN